MLATRETVVEQALAFPLGRIVTRYREKQHLNQETAELHEREIRRYFALCAMYPSERWPMVNSIDELWHTFLLFTKDYHRFCTKLGVPFIHHEPVEATADTAELQRTYVRFINRYRDQFGEPPRTIWPQAIDGSCHDCGGACGGGNCQSNCAQCR